jgi:polyhydroxyalkanoate synthesis regulator protein
MQEQVRKNFDTFERALGLFTPFGADAANARGEGDAEDGQPKLAAPSGKKPGADEIDTLKAELQAMQQRLEKLSRD